MHAAVEIMASMKDRDEESHMKRKSETVNVVFRLPADEYQELKAIGANFDQSPGQSARQIVRDRLRDTHRKDLEYRLESVQAQLRLLAEKMDLLIEMVEASTQVLLTHAGKLGAVDAKEWVTTSFQ